MSYLAVARLIVIGAWELAHQLWHEHRRVRRARRGKPR